MKDVSSEGRTVIFVSHNIHAISNLCKSSFYLSNGQLVNIGRTKEIIDQYMKDGVQNNINTFAQINDIQKRRGNGDLRFTSINVTDRNDQITNEFKTGETICFKISCIVNEKVPDVLCSIYFKAPYTGEVITHTDVYVLETLQNEEKGKQLDFTITIPQNQFKPGVFDLFFWLGNQYEGGAYDIIDSVLPPIIISSSDNKNDILNYVGFVNINSEFKTIIVHYLSPNDAL